MDNPQPYKLLRKLRQQVGQAIQDFKMIDEGDRIMVCMSGGKDSYSMLDFLLHFQKVSPIKFELVAVNLDQKQPNFPEEVLPNYLEKLGVSYRIVERDTYSIVKDKTPEGKTFCSLCSRLRRGTLYGVAEEMGANKLALGHHRNDILETFFLNLFFSGKMEAMPPKYLTDDKKFIVLRPLAYCKEADIAQYALIRNFPIIPCNLCGSQPSSQRNIVKQMLNVWDQEHPGRLDSIFNALRNVSPTHLLDKDLNDFKSLLATVQPTESMW